MSEAGEKIESTSAAAESEESTDVAGKSAPSKNKEGKIRLRQLLSYRWIMKNMFFLLFLASLAVIYIYNGHYADKVVRDINRTNKELKELQYEYKTLKSEVMFRSKQSELAKAVGPFGLKELTAPPFILTDSTK
ncbi:MAG TPA: FtsL-like putative cell division protein [Puia sp.]|nr:FtsL-like putative cell division protein [Puia sp.]